MDNEYCFRIKKSANVKFSSSLSRVLNCNHNVNLKVFELLVGNVPVF